MIHWLGIFLFFGLFAGFHCTKKTESELNPAAGTMPFKPRLVLMDPLLLSTAKQQIQAGDPNLIPAFKKMMSEADKALSAGPFSVTFKKHLPPSGNRHDFMSLAPYWWPDPQSPNGIPYIRRDGETNPERNQYDRIPFWQLDSAVTTLALAYYFSGQEVYADHAAKLLRAWFLDEDTYMNPHLNYGEAIRGICDGRAAGIIEGRAFFRLADAMILLDGSKSWTEQDMEKIYKWYSQYLEWLLQSDIGKDEASKENNHGTWYEVQVSAIALFLNKTDVAEKFLNKIPNRIAAQIEPDGSQPFELVRTRAFHYSAMNVEALFNTAKLGEKVGLDLWNYTTADGRSMRRALEFLTDFAVQEKEWKYPLIRGWENDLELIAVLLRRASLKYQDPAYNHRITRLPGVDLATGRFQLVYPYQEQKTDKN